MRVATDVPPDLAVHPHWLLVQRIVSSSVFVRSHRLQTFLLYVSRCALEKQADHVTEQQIGNNVFGRPAAYNASEDNIVRANARLLRAKLAEYFASGPGLEEPIILTIPTGTYLPRFLPRGEAAPAPKRARRIRLPAAVAAVFLLAAVAVLLRLVLARTPAPAAAPSVWSRIFESRQPTTIVASDYV